MIGRERAGGPHLAVVGSFLVLPQAGCTAASDLATSKRDPYIGTINSEAGKTAAQTLLSLQTRNQGGVLSFGHTDWMNTANPPPVAMIGLFSVAFRCAMAAEQLGKTGDDLTILGFETKTVRYLKSGLMKATHAQRQYYMGYLVPYALYSINVLGLEQTRTLLSAQMVDESRFNAGLDVVKADQLDADDDFLDSLGIGG